MSIYTYIYLSRLGWSFAGPTKVQKCCGAIYDLTLIPPSVIKKEAFEAFSASSAVKAVPRAFDPCTSRGNRADGLMILPLSRVYNSKGLSNLQRGRLLSTTCGATWTTGLLAKIGHQISDSCPLCGMPGDSVPHRLYRCEATREHWRKLPPRWLEEVDSQPLLYNRGLSPNIIVDGKVDNYNFVLIGQDSDDLDTFTFRSSEGPVFLDGSCYNSKFPFATAGFALCQVDQAGGLTKAAYAAVPGTLPQTAALAEHAAFAVLTMLSERSDPVKAVVDCMSTIASYRHGFGFSCE